MLPRGRPGIRGGLIATALLGHVLFLLVNCGTARATRYPPGPGGAYPDTLTIYNCQDPVVVPHPVVPDSVSGISGIVTGLDTQPPGFGFYIQSPGGAPWTGIYVFTGATNKGPGTPWNIRQGDHVVVYGKMQEFGGETEVEGLDYSQSTDDLVCRVTSSGNPLPLFHVGTTNELRESSSNPMAEQWEGTLVKVNGPLRVVRTSSTGGLGTSNSFLCVDNVLCPHGSPGPCDSIFVDGSTLTTYAPPAVGSIVDMVQGIYTQRSRGYRIMLRDANDIQAPTPPSLTDAYSISADTIRVVFDRPVTQASAENVNNYSLGSFSTVATATLVEPSAAHLKIIGGLIPGNFESVTAQSIVSVSSGLPMPAPQTRNFVYGVLTVAAVQGPNVDSLSYSPGGCRDVANFLGANNGAGVRISVTGVEAATVGSLYYLADEGGGQRSGMAVYAPPVPLTTGRKYLVVCSPQEFPSGAGGESELVNVVHLVDRGPGTIPAPALGPSVATLRNTSCDVSQTLTTGEDYEGVRVKLEHVKVVPGTFSPGSSFRVAGPYPSYTDTITVGNAVPRGFVPNTCRVVTVTGILQSDFTGQFLLQPGGDADILDERLDSLVVNEFVARPRAGDREFVEVFNRSSRPFPLGGWSIQVFNADSSASDSTFFSSGDSLPPGGFTIRLDSTFSLFDKGGVIALKDACGVVIDRVGYGDLGGAPISCPLVVPAGASPPPGFAAAPPPLETEGTAVAATEPETLSTSTGRTPGGTDTNSDAADFGIGPPTPLTANQVAAPALGSSARINAVYVYPQNRDSDPVNESLQLYNHTPEIRDVRNYHLSDGFLIQPLFPPGGAVPLEPEQKYDVIAGLNGTSGFEFEEDSRMDLYEVRPEGLVRIDQMGWAQLPPLFPDQCLVRIPDGAGPYGGWDWNTAGGDQSLFYVPNCGLSTPNGDVSDGADLHSALSAPWPSPARGAARFEFVVGRESGARASAYVALYDVAGRRVRLCGRGDYVPGRYATIWDGNTEAGRAAAPGIYFARLVVSGQPVGEVRSVVWLRK